jgi:hypothetical protein
LIHRNFREPNYRCKVTDYKGDSHEWLTYASSEDELRQRLEAQDLAVVEIKAYDFEQWKDRAAGARRTAVEAHDSGQPVNFNSNLWGELKLHLFELFDGKCAYCEARVLHVAWGDVEHYRPKRAVLEDDTHPSYYWLAYDTGNLLPCCPKCNEARGKQTHFPIKAGGQRAYDPGADLDQELPLILHPYRVDHPEQHLAFVPGNVTADRRLQCFGTVEGVTDEGERTRIICNLGRPPLRQERREEQEHFVKDLLLAMNQFDVEQIVALWRDVYTGVRPFSAAIMAQIGALRQLWVVCPSREEILGPPGGGG